MQNKDDDSCVGEFMQMGRWGRMKEAETKEEMKPLRRNCVGNDRGWDILLLSVVGCVSVFVAR